MSLQPISKAMANPAAQRVFHQIMAMPDDESAQIYATMVVAGALQYDLQAHHGLLQKRLDEVIAKRVDRVKTVLSKSAIAKSRDGGSLDAVVAASVVIAKDFDFSTEERRQFADRQERDQSGRFRTMRQRIMYTDRQRPLPDRHALRLGIPKPTHLHGQDLANYQQAYSQVAAALAPFTSLTSDEGFMHLTYIRPNGQRVTETVDLPNEVRNGQFTNIGVESQKFQRGGKLVEVGVAVNPNLSVQGAAFDLVGALGGGATAGSLASRAVKTNDNEEYKGALQLGTFATDWNGHHANDVYNPSSRVFRRFSAGSKLLTALVGDHAPEKVKLAAQAGDFVGQYGEEAAKVIGPHADRAAYRYRGVERKPDPMLQQIINNARSQIGDPNAARNALIYGQPGREEERGGRVVRGEPRPSPLITYFAGTVDREGNTKGGRLPSPDLGSLQVKSGVVPPSEGIIIDRKGNVVTQAVGYGDDWYLPFNLKTLSKLKGGEYIRTRTWGGPTTEDIYAALITGAKSITVVSHNGVYTIEFDDSFRGGRRFNDKAARMVKRYGHILDAVKSKEVTLSGIPEDRVAELKDEAALEFDPKTERVKYENKLKELKQDELADPKMSAAARQTLAETFLEDRASDMLTDIEGHKDWTTLADNYVNRRVERYRDLHDRLSRDGEKLPPYDDANTKAEALRQVRTPEATIAAYNWDRDWERYLANAELEYKAKQSPLNLDGAGYEKAMSALREQFPYYIANTSWQPRRRGGYDTGYVKPRFNRPADVWAGYYDPTITGFGTQYNSKGKLTGKITADRTRYQNYGVSEAVRQDGRLSERRNAAGEVISRPAERGAQATTETGARSERGSVDPVAQAAQRQMALRALRDSIRNRREPILWANPQSGQTEMVPIESVRPRLIRNLPMIFGMSEDQFDAAFRSNRAAAESAFRNEVERFKEFGEVDTTLEDAVFAADDADRGVPWTDESVVDIARNKNKMFDFGEEFRRGRRPPELYAHKARELTQRIPGADFDSDNLDAVLNQYIDAEYEKFLGHGRIGHRHRNADLGQARENIKRAAQVKVLKRRHRQALADDVARREELEQRNAARDARRPSSLQETLVLGNIEQLQRALNEQARVNREEQERRTIEGRSEE